MINRTTIFAGLLLSSAFLMQAADSLAAENTEKAPVQKTDAYAKTAASTLLDLDIFVVPNNMRTMGHIRSRFLSDTQANRIEAIFGKLPNEEECVEVILVDPSQNDPVQLAFDGTNPNFPNSDKVLPMYIPLKYVPDEGKAVQFTVNNRVLKVTGNNLKYKYRSWGTMQAAIARLKVCSYTAPEAVPAQDAGDEKSAPSGSAGS